MARRWERESCSACGLRGGLPVALLTLLLVLTALQRGGYYAESWSLPTIACGWLVALVLIAVGAAVSGLKSAGVIAVAVAFGFVLIFAAYAFVSVSSVRLAFRAIFNVSTGTRSRRIQ